MSDAFSQDLKEEVAAFDPIIDERLADYYRVPPSCVHSLEAISDGRYDYTDEERGQQLLDFAGIDKVIDLSGIIIPVGQRVRNDDPDYEVDFAMRVSNGQGPPAEYTKIMNGWRDGGAYPNVYAQAVRNADNEIIEFALVDIDQFCESIDAGTLSEVNESTEPNGVVMRYYEYPALKREGCVLTHWMREYHGKWTSGAPENDHYDDSDEDTDEDGDGITSFAACVVPALW